MVVQGGRFEVHVVPSLVLGSQSCLAADAGLGVAAFDVAQKGVT